MGVWPSCNLFLANGVLLELANNPELFWLPISRSHKADPARVIKRIRRGAWQGGLQGFSRSDQCILSLILKTFQDKTYNGICKMFHIFVRLTWDRNLQIAHWKELISILILCKFRAIVLYTQIYFKLNAQHIVLQFLHASATNRNHIQVAILLEATSNVLCNLPAVNGEICTCGIIPHLVNNYYNCIKVGRGSQSV